MEFKDVLAARHSVRRFLPDPVPEETLRDIVRDAQRAPSTVNAQEWRVWIATGETLEAIRSEYAALNAKAAPALADLQDLAKTGWSPAAKARQKAFAGARTAAGLDGEKLESQSRLFHAPAVAYLTVPAPANPWAVLDLGGFEMSMLLAAASRGIGSIPAYNLIKYPGPVKRLMGIPETEALVIGIGLGYEAECPLNRFRSTRAPLEDFLVIKK